MIKKNISPSPFRLCIIILCISLACGQIGSVSGRGIKLGYPALDYTGLAWLSEAELAAFTADDAGGFTGYYLENDGHLNSLELPPFVAKLDCKGVNENNNIYYTHPSILPDGRLGLINGCISRGDPPGLKRRYLIAYDFQTKETKLLVKEPLPNYLSNAFTLNPDMTAGLVQIYDGLDGTVYWISRRKVAPVDFAISDGKRSFLPGKDFPRFSEGPEQGIVFSPAWSPDGKTIAFFVTLDAMGRRDSSRSEGEYKIFFMDPREQKPDPVVEKIHEPAELIWSPDSKWLAFIGTYGILRTHGIWMYSVATGKIYRVASGEFSHIALSPAGNKLAGTICEPDHPNLICNRYEIWEYDVSSILKR